MRKKYEKPALPVVAQLEILKNRALTIDNLENAVKYLTFHNYYYVSGYIYYFEKKAEYRTHVLSAPFMYSDVQALMTFDQALRELVLSAIQPIEVAIRCTLARIVSLKYGPFCLENPEILKKKYRYENLQKTLNKALTEHENEPFISHFTSTYEDPIPPIWVMTEILSIGSISWIYDSLTTDLQKQVAHDLNVDHILLVSWFKAITELRNTCAHHSRLWNKVFVNAPKIRKTERRFSFRSDGENRLGSLIPFIIDLLTTISALPDWEARLRQLLMSCPYIKPDDLGLSAWWSIS